eukprot:2951463-Prymnesium_polylepis.1
MRGRKGLGPHRVHELQPIFSSPQANRRSRPAPQPAVYVRPAWAFATINARQSTQHGRRAVEGCGGRLAWYTACRDTIINGTPSCCRRRPQKAHAGVSVTTLHCAKKRIRLELMD